MFKDVFVKVNNLLRFVLNRDDSKERERREGIRTYGWADIKAAAADRGHWWDDSDKPRGAWCQLGGCPVGEGIAPLLVSVLLGRVLTSPKGQWRGECCPSGVFSLTGAGRILWRVRQHHPEIVVETVVSPPRQFEHTSGTWEVAYLIKCGPVWRALVYHTLLSHHSPWHVSRYRKELSVTCNSWGTEPSLHARPCIK